MSRLFFGDDIMVKTVCEVFSRTVGYIRPVYLMNDSKQAEFHDRIMYNPVGVPLQSRLK